MRFDQTRGAGMGLLEPLAAAADLLAQATKFLLDLFACPCPLPDATEALLELRSQRPGEDLGLRSAGLVQHLVGGVEHGTEELELLAEDLEEEAICLVVLRDEVDHRHVARLAVTVAAADPLFDPLRVPG